MSWQIHLNNSRIQFTAQKFKVITVQGHFSSFTGTLDLDEVKHVESNVAVRIAAESIETGNARRNTHLKSPDFLDVDKYPFITFQSKSVELSDSNHGHVIGDLTIRDITREVVLEVDHGGLGTDQHTASFEAHTTLKCQDWGITWAGLLGKLIIGETLAISIELEAIKQAEVQELFSAKKERS